MGEQAQPRAVGLGSSSSKNRWPLTSVANLLRAHLDRHRVEAICAGSASTEGSRAEPRRPEKSGRIALAGRRLEQEAVVGERRLGPRSIVGVDREFISAGKRIVEQEEIDVRAGKVRDQAILGGPVGGRPAACGLEAEPERLQGATRLDWCLRAPRALLPVRASASASSARTRRQTRAAAGFLGAFRERVGEPPPGVDHRRVAIGQSSAGELKVGLGENERFARGGRPGAGTCGSCCWFSAVLRLIVFLRQLRRAGVDVRERLPRPGRAPARPADAAPGHSRSSCRSSRARPHGLLRPVGRACRRGARLR